jgi:hypothetical protein
LVTKWLEGTAAARPSELGTRKNELISAAIVGPARFRDDARPEAAGGPVSSIFGKRCSQVLNYNLALDFRGRIGIFLPFC